MSMRFLHIKRAYVLDPTHTLEVERDIALNSRLVDTVYNGENIHDVCAITEDGEWLIRGRRIDPSAILQLYSICFVYIHSPSDIYDRAFHACKAHSQKYVLIYKATDAVLHHSVRLESLIKTNALKAKVAHQVHVDMQEFNENFTSSEVIAGKHIRNVFLPVHVMTAGYKTYVPDFHTELIAHNYEELAAHIDALRHSGSNVTLRSHKVGDLIFVVSIPNLRGEKIYVSMSLKAKEIQGNIHFQKASLSAHHREMVHSTVQEVARVLFPKAPVVYMLKVHVKQGVYIQGTSPLYFFILHNQDFLFELSLTHGIDKKDLFESLI